MSIRILVTTSSFIDTPGAHHAELNSLNAELIKVRGPLSEEDLLSVVKEKGQFDAFLVGEDQFTARVFGAISPRAKVVSRYGVGLDKVDVEAARQHGVEIRNTPGVNHTTVTEHMFGLLLGLIRHIAVHHEFVKTGQWRRITGHELVGMTLSILGFGRVGREVAKRAMAFGMKVLVYNSSWSEEQDQFVKKLEQIYSDSVFAEFPPSIRRVEHADEALNKGDFISLHMNLTKGNSHFLNSRRINQCKRGAFVINVSRGGLVDQYALAEALKSGKIGGYAADVIDPEPLTQDNPLIGMHNVLITPHVGSRTFQSVVRQGIAAVRNIRLSLEKVSA